MQKSTSQLTDLAFHRPVAQTMLARVELRSMPVCRTTRAGPWGGRDLKTCLREYCIPQGSEELPGTVPNGWREMRAHPCTLVPPLLGHEVERVGGLEICGNADWEAIPCLRGSNMACF